jgi:hypothetical protein
MNRAIIMLATKDTNRVMPDLIRHPVFSWIPAFAGMTTIGMFYCRISERRLYLPR